MGLTDRRKTAKSLVDSRKNWKILKNLFPRFVNFKGGAKLAYGCVYYFRASVTQYAR